MELLFMLLSLLFSVETESFMALNPPCHTLLSHTFIPSLNLDSFVVCILYMLRLRLLGGFEGVYLAVHVTINISSGYLTKLTNDTAHLKRRGHHLCLHSALSGAPVRASHRWVDIPLCRDKISPTWTGFLWAKKQHWSTRQHLVLVLDNKTGVACVPNFWMNSP